MNDKLQIRDLVAMLTATGIDQCAYVEICGVLAVGLHKQEPGHYCLGTTNIKAQMEELEIKSYEEGYEDGTDAMRNAISRFLNEGEDDKTIEQVGEFLKTFTV